jgi:hypothetical protein
MPAARRRPRSVRSVASHTRFRGETGGGPISAWIGFVVFLALLLFAVQALFNLYATSVVSAVAYDAARRVAGADGGPDSMAAAEASARQSLGRYANRVAFDWSATDGDTVVLAVHAQNPRMLLPPLAGPLAFDEIDRTVRVRVERFR